MPTRRFNTCFIAAPQGVDTLPLRQALEERDITWWDATSVTHGSSLLRSIESAIAKADFMCAVLASGFHTENVLFEIGLARGRGRPLLLITEPSMAVPSMLESVTVARVGALDRDAMDLHLDTFLAHASSPKRESHAKLKQQLRPVEVPWAAGELSDIESGGVGGEYRLARLLAHLFRLSGAVVSEAPAGREYNADMALWIDELEGPLGNPLLVEVKVDLRSENDWRVAVNEFRGSLDKAHARTGLLIHLRPKESGRRIPVGGDSLIVSFSADEILHLLAGGRFAEGLVSRRNYAMHGGR